MDKDHDCSNKTWRKQLNELDRSVEKFNDGVKTTLLKEASLRFHLKELHCMLKAKEREVEYLCKELSEKDELLKKYCCQIEEFKNDMKVKNKKYREILKQIKCVSRKECDKFFEDLQDDTEDVNISNLEESVLSFLKDLENQKNSVIHQFRNAECQLRAMNSDKRSFLMEKNEIASQLQKLRFENEKLIKELSEKKILDLEKEELTQNIEKLKTEKAELTSKVSVLQENIQELSNNFRETRWALASEVAEKHDQVQDLRKSVVALEEQLRQADMQTHFKDDIIKELRKELKTSRKSERRGLYDVVTELRGRKNTKNECLSTVTFDCDSTIYGMSSFQSDMKGSDIDYSSAISLIDQMVQDDKQENANDSSGLQSQVDCLKKNFKIRMEQLREQKEITRDLEEELTRTKMDLTVLQEKYERQERRCKSLAVSSLSDPGLSCHYTALSCAINKIEDTLRNLSTQRNCGLSNFDVDFELEMEKIRSVKNDLKNFERSRSKNQFTECKEKSSSKEVSESQQLCEGLGEKYAESDESESCKCNLIHLNDVEVFREKAVTGVVTLEQMKEQIDILEDLIKKYVDEFPCDCDKGQVKMCEEKLEKLHMEFDEITQQLFLVLQKLNKHVKEERYESFNHCFEGSNCKEESSYSQGSLPLHVSCLKFESHNTREDICNQEKKVELLSHQLGEELQQKRRQLEQYNNELDERIYEILKLREVVKEVGQKLMQIYCGQSKVNDQEIDRISRNASALDSLFCDLKEFWFILDNSSEALFDIPKKLREDNERLKEKLNCLEKCVSNKEETLRVTQDTVKLRECQIEELKSRTQSFEDQCYKLAKDVEEKCNLVASLQEALRKYKKFEMNLRSTQVESLEFEICNLDDKLKKSQKEVNFKDQKLESLLNKVTSVSSKNFVLIQEMKIMEARLKSIYKTSHLFEKMANDLQIELNSRESEIESLHEKINELENELDSQFKKCERRAADDSKCIQELRLTLKNFQNELSCTKENYNMPLSDIEFKLKKELEMSELRQSDLNNFICQPQAEIKELQNLVQENTREECDLPRMTDLECITRQAEVRTQMYENKIMELQKVLEYTVLEHEKERKNILQELCNEKKKNLENKSLITKLNESIKRKTINEKSLNECIKHITEVNEVLKTENQELKTEIEARKKIMCSMEKADIIDLSEIEELICGLKIQKSELRTKCYNLKAEVDKETKLRKILECRVEDLNNMLKCKVQKFSELVDNYKNSSLRIQETLMKMKKVEESLISVKQDLNESLKCDDELDECQYLKKLLDIKTVENAKLISRAQTLKVEIESIKTENAAAQADKDFLISRLQHEAACLDSEVQELQAKFQKMSEENKILQLELRRLSDKENCLQTEFTEKQSDLFAKLRAAICEKNDLLNSVDELQKQLQQICFENINKEKLNKELTEECSRLKINNNISDNHLRSKTDKIICNLSKEVRNLHSELFEVKENYNALSEDYQTLLKQFKCCEKKKSNLEKLYMEVNAEKKDLQEISMKFEKELYELKTQNALLKEKVNNKNDDYNGPEDKKKLLNRVRDLTAKINSLEKVVIPNLEQEIAEKSCCIENLKMELREANISSQKMRNEALRVIQYTKKYLAAQRCANETLKTRLEYSNKRGNILGAENRELEEQLKSVTQMNEFLLYQLENGKDGITGMEPRSFSPLPWGSSNVERDTSSSEYLAESGIQSMQPSPTNLDYVYDHKQDSKRASTHWNSLKRNKYTGCFEYSCRNGVR